MRGVFVLQACLLATCSQLFTGCIAIRRTPSVNEEVLHAERPIREITEVEEVLMNAHLQGSDLVVDARFTGQLKSGIAKRIRVTTKRPVLSVGLFPGLYLLDRVSRSRHNRWLNEKIGGPAGLWSFGNILTLGLPTWSSLFVEPFREEYREYREDSPYFPPLASFGWVGCLKYSITSVKEHEQYAGSAGRNESFLLPLTNATIRCNIPKLKYYETFKTDKAGKARKRFDLAFSGYADGELILKSANDVDAQFSNMKVTKRKIRLSGNVPVKLPVSRKDVSESIRRNALPQAHWPLEAVALANFRVDGLSATEANLLREWFFSALGELNYFKLASRFDTEMILSEQNFQKTNMCDDTECLVEMGQLLSVSKMIGGTVGRIGTSTLIVARFVDVESGQLVCTASGRSRGADEDLLDLVEGVARDLCRKYAETCSE